MKQTARDQHEKRKLEKALRQKQDNALTHLSKITRKVPPRVDNNILKKPTKERNYLYLRSDESGKEDTTLLKRMVDQELEKDQRELLELAGRVGYLDPNRTLSHRDTSIGSAGATSKKSDETKNLKSSIVLMRQNISSATNLYRVPSMNGGQNYLKPIRKIASPD